MAWMIPIVPGNNNKYRRNTGAKVASAILLLFGLLIFLLSFIGFNRFDISYGIHPWIILSVIFFISVIFFVSLIAFIANSMSKKYKDNNKASINRKNIMDLYSNYYQTNSEVPKVNPYVKKPEIVYQIPLSENKKKNDSPIVSNVHYCRYCGSEVDNTAVYCHQCGNKLD
jgi:glucan phosphoethanolaminetransferase (alkaline phosphatase superfamily)